MAAKPTGMNGIVNPLPGPHSPAPQSGVAAGCPLEPPGIVAEQHVGDDLHVNSAAGR